MVVYSSRLLPIIGIELGQDQSLPLDQLQAFCDIKPASLVRLDRVSPIPPVNYKILRQNNLVGWQVTVGILDSGVDDLNLRHILSHDDFTGCGIRDNIDHGTSVLKIIKKFAQGSSLICAKITNNGNKDFDEIIILQGLEWAYNNGANIINCSFSVERKDQCDGSCDVCSMVELLASKNIIIVTSAGNRGPDEGTIGCPGVTPSILAVGAINRNDNQIEDFSSRGIQGQFKPDLVAPGNVCVDTNIKQGTSFSAPIVSGICAALFQKYRHGETVIKVLRDTAIDLGFAPHQQGYGLVNPEGAWEVLNYGQGANKA